MAATADTRAIDTAAVTDAAGLALAARLELVVQREVEIAEVQLAQRVAARGAGVDNFCRLGCMG